MAGTLQHYPIVEGQSEKRRAGVFEKRLKFTDDASHNGVSDEVVCNSAGMLDAVRVKFGSPAPTSLLVIVKDSHGNTIASETLTASGSLLLDRERGTSFNGLILSVSNGTNSAVADIWILWV